MVQTCFLSSGMATPRLTLVHSQICSIFSNLLGDPSLKVSYFYVTFSQEKRGQFDADRKCHMKSFHQAIWCQHYVCIKMFWRIHICWKRQLLSSIKRTWLKFLIFSTKLSRFDPHVMKVLKVPFFRKWDSFFKSPNLPKKLFQKTIYPELEMWNFRPYQ